MIESTIGEEPQSDNGEDHDNAEECQDYRANEGDGEQVHNQNFQEQPMVGVSCW